MDKRVADPRAASLVPADHAARGVPADRLRPLVPRPRRLDRRLHRRRQGAPRPPRACWMPAATGRPTSRRPRWCCRRRCATALRQRCLHDIPADGLDEECSGLSFRHEPSLDPARMQIFRMYEFVRIGTPEQALEHRDEWLERGLDGADRARPPGARSEAANDPFFGRVGQMLAVNQLDSQLKYEMCVDLTEAKPTAIAPRQLPRGPLRAPFRACDPADGTRRTAPASASGSSGSPWPCSPRTACSSRPGPRVRSALGL